MQQPNCVLLHLGSLAHKKLIQPGFQTVVEGDPFAFKCQSEKPPMWSHNLSPMLYYKIREGSIFIRRAKLSDAGLYTCKGTYSNGTYFMETAVLEVVGE